MIFESTFDDSASGTSHDGTVRLRNVFLHVTKACNLRCTYCYFSAQKPLPDELTTGELTALWRDMVAIQPEKVVFTGGEPLLRPDLFDLLRGLQAADPEHRVRRCLNTNGQLVTPQVANDLVGLADEVRVSLDGFRDRNDAHRGKGNFDVAMRALETFYSVGFEPKVLVTVTAETVRDLEELICFLVGKKFTRINLNVFRPIGRGSGHEQWRPDPRQMQAAVRRAWERCHPDEPMPPPLPEQETQCHCGVGQFLNIMPDGNVFPCHVLTNPEFRCGNVREQRLTEICRRNGLLGQLAAINFHELAKKDERLAPLTKSGTCMGTVYDEASDSLSWKRALPMLGQSQISVSSG